MKTNKFYQTLIGLALISVIASCDLEEEIFTEILSSEFGQTTEEVNSLVGAAYSSYGGWIGGPWVTQVISSDIGIVPTRGTDWAENGQWARIHEHDLKPDDFYTGGAWNSLYTGINNVNRILYQLEEVGTDAALQTIKELKVLRALNYYYLMDIYGNIPLVTSFTDAVENPTTTQRAGIFAFIISEVEGVINDLPTTVGGSSYGKINKWTAHALLAKMYLNAEVWNGTAQWDKANQHATAIIDSGNYSLVPSFFDNFSIDNEGSSENIFVLVYDKVFSGGMNLAVRTLHYSSQQTYNFTQQPWNGFSSMEDFYNSFEANDVRLGSFIEGQQYDSSGAILLDNQAEPEDPNGPPINFTPNIRNVRDALRQDGVRIGKFEMEMGGIPGQMSNDFPLFRLGDIILTKAEAELRLGNPGGALILANMIRDRAGVAPFTELTLENLLAERGRETCFEAYRRQDQIRFGTFNDAWFDKPADVSTHINIFPVSTGNMAANPSLTQNPGY
jgi:hypothetical protein